MYLAYHLSLGIDWDNAACAVSFQCVRSNGNVLDVQAQKVTPAERSFDDVQMKRWSGLFPKIMNLGLKTLEEGRVVRRSVLQYSTEVQDPTDDVLFVENEITEKDALWNFGDLA